MKIPKSFVAFGYAATCCLSATLAGCTTAKQAATAYNNQRPPTPVEIHNVLVVMRDTFVDPHSIIDAEISNVIQMPGNAKSPVFIVCVLANAKNRMGGYVGRTFTQFSMHADGVVFDNQSNWVVDQNCSPIARRPFNEVSLLKS